MEMRMSGARQRTAAGIGIVVLTAMAACGSGDAASDQPQESGPTPVPVTNTYGDSMPHPTVTLSTTLGDVRIELFPEDAPVSVENFLAYVESGFYDGLIFHRVIAGFMIQAGGHEPDMTLREATRAPVRNESDNGLHNLRATVAMARTRDPHSARAQFFINLVDNLRLDHGGTWGYTVFGRVIGGMDVVDEIAARPTARVGGSADVPVESVVIVAATRGEDIGPTSPVDPRGPGSETSGDAP